MPRTYSFKPLSIFSSEFAAHPVDGHGPSFRVKINSLGEQGWMVNDAEQDYVIAKQGFASGRWTLRDDQGVIADAQKFSPFSRTFSIALTNGSLALTADNSFTRAFTISGVLRAGMHPSSTPPTDPVAPRTSPQPAGPLGKIRPNNAFTRGATITFEDALEPRVAMFCFWLAALMWRRQANRS